jgi:hypothetical protein
MHLASRRAPVALGLLVGFGVILAAALHYHWSIAGGRAVQMVIPLTIETGAAAVVAVSMHGPFGEVERATGRWLPWLRIAGLGLLSAVGFGGPFGWVGPMAYLLVTEVALGGDPTTPWVWAARPSHDRGAAACAAVVFFAGIIAITLRGARDVENQPQ